MMDKKDPTLAPTKYVDSDSADVVAFARDHAGEGSDRDRAIRLYYAVRDGVRYDMMTFGVDPEQFVASNCLKAPSAYC
ncbi:hypothetical protein AB4144_29880, partial [Rhizobiaceae sp. 2RAB30]